MNVPICCYYVYFSLSLTRRHKSHETPIVTCDGAQWSRDKGRPESVDYGEIIITSQCVLLKKRCSFRIAGF